MTIYVTEPGSRSGAGREFEPGARHGSLLQRKLAYFASALGLPTLGLCRAHAPLRRRGRSGAAAAARRRPGGALQWAANAERRLWLARVPLPRKNPWPKPPANKTLGNKTCRTVTFNRQSHHAVNDARTECVPLDYGASKCKAWDKDTSFTTVCKGASTPGSGNYYFKRPARICIILGRIRHHFLLPRRTACSY